MTATPGDEAADDGALTATVPVGSERDAAVAGGRADERSEDDGRPSRPSMRWLRWVGLAAGVIQAIVLIAYSAHIFSRFDLTLDFAVENQAWTQIADGNLSPYLTINPHNYPHYGYPYWQDHLELITWPLALVWFVFRSSFDLLVIQDLALAGCTVIATLFVADLLEAVPVAPVAPVASGDGADTRSTWQPWWLPVLGLGAVGVLLINPWTYWSASFDFHIQALATLFALLAARELWKGRRLRSLWWVAALLLCGNVAGTYLIGIGIFALLCVSRRDLRLPGLGLVVGGVAASALISAVGGAEGTLISGNYGYLAHAAPGAVVGTGAIIVGVLTHPGTPLHMLWSRAHLLYLQLASAGMIGVLSPLGFGMSVIILLENGLNASSVFSTPDAAFQSLPVYAFVLVGTVAVLLWLHRLPWGAMRWVTPVVALAVLVQAVVVAALWIPRAPQTFLTINGATAAELARVESTIPSGTEVIASQGVIGRFADRRLAFPFLDINDQGQEVPTFGRPVVVVLTDDGIEFATPSGTAAAVTFLRTVGAHQITASNGVYAFLLQPKPGAKYIVFPPTSAG